MKHYVVEYRNAYIRWVLKNDDKAYYEVWGYYKKEFMVGLQGAYFMQGCIPKEDFDILRVPRNGNHIIEVWIDEEKIIG